MNGSSGEGNIAMTVARINARMKAIDDEIQERMQYLKESFEKGLKAMEEKDEYGLSTMEDVIDGTAHNILCNSEHLHTICNERRKLKTVLHLLEGRKENLA